MNNSVDLSVGLNAELSQELEPEKPVLTILYQDEFLVAVNKPAGLFVHRSFMDKDEIYFALQLVRDQIGQYVYPVHRLDRPTSGVLIFALTKEVARKLSEDFANKSKQAELISELTDELIPGLSSEVLQPSSIDVGYELDNDLTGGLGNELDDKFGNELTMVKTYYALVRGHISNASGLIDHALKEKLDKIGDKHVSKDKPAQSAKSYYQVEQQASLPIKVGKFDSVRYSLVQVRPITGRRHQIRRHLAHLRHPIIGDINYGDNKQNPFFIEHFNFKRLMLHAHSLAFKHPVTQNLIKIIAPFDEQWQQVFTELNWPMITD